MINLDNEILVASNCKFNIGDEKLYSQEEILQALQEKADRDNPQPLTLEQLKNRVGKPVWVVDNDDYGYWCTVMYSCCIKTAMGFRIEFSEIPNKTKTIYDHEPKGE